MTTLNDRHKQLLFDYSLGLTSEPENDQVEALIAANEEAVELYQSIQMTLAPLDTVEVEPCPDELTERLFARMREFASPASGRSMDSSVSDEPIRSRPLRLPLWRNWTEVLAAAAAILVFVSVLFPAVGHMRGRSWQTQCGGHLAGIYSGLRSYVSDHDGLLPSVAMTPGAPWYRVGHQGNENQSNTRQIWLLPKLGYVDPSRFLCPGRSDSRKLRFDGFNAQTFADFPSRDYILYSIRIPCPTSNHRDLTRKGVLLADRNPLTEEFPLDPSAMLCLQLCEKMMKSNSRNHAGRGQNALHYDGSVEFTPTRHTSISDDDIYILRGMGCGTEIRGCELPDSDLDIFLAP
jgi:hypothetical protein